MREKKPFKKWHLILLVIIVVFAMGKKIYDSFWSKATIKIGGQEVRVLVADTPARRFKGWSDQKDMGKYGGMLFVFPTAVRYAMVMRDMRFPLDIVWLDNGKVVDIAPNLPPEPNVPEDKLTVYGARASSTMVLELQAGFRDRTGIKIGDEVRIIKN